MFTKSIWNAYADTTSFPSLDGDISADVVIIGGGITGISAAHRLSAKIRSVVVIEEMKVGGGTSSHSTGNLYVTIDQGLSHLRSKYNDKTVSKVIKARGEALNAMGENVKRYNIDCDFKRCTWYLYSANQSNDKKIEKEVELAGDIKLGIVGEDVTLPYPVSKIISLPEQAQINPMRYVQGLAKAIHSENCRIYENTRATKIEDRDNDCVVHTPKGKINAKHVIHATHTPKGFMFVQTLLGPYREYGVACKLTERIRYDGIYWGYYDDGEKYSTRVYERDDEQLLLVVGKPHKVGQAEDNQAHIRALEKFAKEHFPVADVIYRWGGQHYRPADLLPFIGRKSKHSNIFIATGLLDRWPCLWHTGRNAHQRYHNRGRKPMDRTV
ncbi:FAD dependent oxidoreductase [Fulvivirga imtechensis AK7]|uniref:FAD dependent oxidoreductase n=1 Tax=Fulvivirga imtechensis AK7 TaxID=1237149 RepID=L8JHS3_9BACT|nr:FAD-dependent oxidoreductase [Fulvivirga imtechensis]ELR68365.1 FAD dependent oxidoreductase [Fulvivirga imtechensis AK7]